MICKRCHKREINTARSKNLCDFCLDSQRKRSIKSSLKTGLWEIRKAKGLIANSNGLCKACFNSPISKGGSNTVNNAQPLCASCNSRKHTKIIDFRPFGSSILEWT